MEKKQVVKQKKKKNPLWVKVKTIGFLLASCVLLFYVFEDVSTMFSLVTDISDKNSEKVTIESQISSLEKEKEDLENPEYVKRFARGKYMVSKEGEQLFKLPSKNSEEKDNN